MAAILQIFHSTLSCIFPYAPRACPQVPSASEEGLCEKKSKVKRFEQANDFLEYLDPSSQS
jgi:hypothetical protein